MKDVEKHKKKEEWEHMKWPFEEWRKSSIKEAEYKRQGGRSKGNENKVDRLAEEIERKKKPECIHRRTWEEQKRKSRR